MATKIRPEPDWNTAYNPDVLLAIIGTEPHLYLLPEETGESPNPRITRRFRLLNVACARMVWDMLSVNARNAVLIRERFADGRATLADMQASWILPLAVAATFQQQARNAATANVIGAARSAAKALATRAAGPAPQGGSPVAVEWQTAWNDAFAAARAHQAELVRDIFPPPGYAPRFDPEWRTSTVVALAQQMDTSGDFSAVPILADALQDAGCYDAVMLDRCRAKSGIHSRGNWVVDLVLGRE